MGFLDEQVALVTGGGSGIGKAVVEAFIAHGARVGILDRDPAKLAGLNAEFGDKICSVAGDVTSFEANERAVSQTVAAFGRLDVLVCVAGVWDLGTSILDLPAEKISGAFDEIFGVNVKGNLLAVKAAAKHLIESKGSIILTASNGAFYAAGGGPLYTASKFAVRGLVTQLAYELAPVVRVNGVAPGGTVTGLQALHSLGQESFRLNNVPNIGGEMSDVAPLQFTAMPADHAGAFLYLASHTLSPTVTGALINSDCGLGVRGLTKTRGYIPELG